MGQEEGLQPLQLFSPHVWDPRVVPQLAGFAPKPSCYLTLPPCCISCWSQLDSQPSRILLHSTAQPQPHCTSDVPAFPLHLFSLGFGDKLQNKGSVFILAALSASFQRGPDPAVLYGMLQGTQTPNLSPPDPADLLPHSLHWSSRGHRWLWEALSAPGDSSAARTHVQEYKPSASSAHLDFIPGSAADLQQLFPSPGAVSSPALSHHQHFFAPARSPSSITPWLETEPDFEDTALPCPFPKQGPQPDRITPRPPSSCLWTAEIWLVARGWLLSSFPAAKLHYRQLKIHCILS